MRDSVKSAINREPEGTGLPAMPSRLKTLRKMLPIALLPLLAIIGFTYAFFGTDFFFANDRIIMMCYWCGKGHEEKLFGFCGTVLQHDKRAYETPVSLVLEVPGCGHRWDYVAAHSFRVATEFRWGIGIKNEKQLPARASQSRVFLGMLQDIHGRSNGPARAQRTWEALFHMSLKDQKQFGPRIEQLLENGDPIELGNILLSLEE